MSHHQTIQAEFQQKLDMNELLNCTRCGFCQPSCPTFVQTGGKESSSPRGRIALMKAVVDGVLEPDEDFERELSLCLGCRACESACPSGVNYGHLLEQAREILHEHKTYSWPTRLVRSFFFKHVLPSTRMLKTLGTLLWLYQRTGLQWLIRKTRLHTLILPKQLVNMERILPNVPSPVKLWKQHQPRKGVKTDQNKAAALFFMGCIMDVLFQQTNERTFLLAQETGNAVDIPAAQTCCGALHAHAGDTQTAIQLAKQNIIAFEQKLKQKQKQHGNEDRVDAQEEQGGEAEQKHTAILTNAGGCGAFLKEYPHLLRAEPEWQKRAETFSARIKDISTWLSEHSLEKATESGSLTDHCDPSRVQNTKSKGGNDPILDESFRPELVTYQDSCHLRHGLKVDRAPRELLQQVKGVHYVELKNAHMCCGSAGIYNMIETEMAMKVLDHKMEEVKKTKAHTIVTSNPGCLLQMKLGIQREGLEESMRAVHLVDYLYEKQRLNERIQ